MHHYTSAAGLLGILKTGTLRATEHTGLNDFAEISAGQGFVLDRWLEVRESFLDEFGPLYTEKVSGGLRHLQRGFSSLSATSPYVFCASNDPDDVNQWRLYADNGRGFAITLDTTAALDLVQPHATPVNDDADQIGEQSPPLPTRRVSDWKPVLYQEKQKLEAFEDVLGWVKGQVATLSLLSEPHPFHHQALVQEVRKAVDSLCALIKTRGFAGENESRIVINLDKLSHKYIDFRDNSYGIVRSTSLTTPPTRPLGTTLLPITNVTLGPSQHFDLAAPTIEALLDRHGYAHVKVKKSESSLRNP